MTARDLPHDLQAKDIRLTVQGECLVYDAPNGVLSAELLDTLRQHKAELLVLLTQASLPMTARGDTMSQASSVAPDTALQDLRAPVHLWSNLLQEDFYVCAAKGQAGTLLAHGEAVYLPGEIRQLQAMQVRSPGTFPEKLNALHQAKRTFGATLGKIISPGEAPGIAQRSRPRPGAIQNGDSERCSTFLSAGLLPVHMPRKC